MKQILISSDGETVRIAVTQSGRLVEYRMEEGSDGLSGSIYLGRVTDVLPGIRAAFVDIGLPKNGYLALDDVPRSSGKRAEEKRSPSHTGRIHEGEALLVQIEKEETGTKGGRLTAEISLPGRKLVYLPFGRQVMVSRKMVGEAERSRLRELMAGHLHDGEGVIVRTMAAGSDDDDLIRELEYLRGLWQEAAARAKGAKPPRRLFDGGGLAARVLHDWLNHEVGEVLLDHSATYQQVKRVMEKLYPELVDRLSFYQGKASLFEREGVEAEIDRALQRQVPLPHGGFLVIDRTEAMTVIDVNTGTFTGQGGRQVEETILQTNLEAAAEIAHQLRLRDIGGIIIIDFIDMTRPADQERVLERLQAELAKDRTPTRVAGMTRLGLVEMTRKRERKSIGELLTTPCPVCRESGRTLAPAEVARRFLREVRGLVMHQDAQAIVGLLPPQVMACLDWAEQEKALSVHLLLKEEGRLAPHAYRIIYAGSLQEARQRFAGLGGIDT
ncbi:Rne/Rng family ribonuclease [Brevibacillus sp. SYP-B805]|uniref:Rne/Rng family ribonuclease n=1 Tax=Brevibacillus sp. SYP-B805 TaxID=1578199 RepID=UPI0013E9A7B1|nr:Rne/Rng family ribonuclease [Brevibacillus sp. SYP-B805]NGQ94300.1 Rne/Rng family ribonuclease [Brevibacillus sp. SYP-B805]